MSIVGTNSRIFVGAPLKDWQHNVVGDHRDWAIVYEGNGGGPRVVETAALPTDLVDELLAYRQRNPQMAINIMHRSGKVFQIPKEIPRPARNELKSSAW